MQVLRRKHTTPTLSPALLGRFVTVLAVALSLLAPAMVTPATAEAKSSVRLMIDPGHGGKDPGAVGPGLQEKDSSLAISRMVAESARRQGWDVAMTRNSDKFIELPGRPAAASRFKATAFVSIHSNSTGAAAKGFMTIFRSVGGRRLGDAIMRQLMPQTPYGDIGNRSDVRGLAVLRGAKMPAVIVELLAVTNRHENAALKDPVRQRQMAEAIVKGVAAYHNVKYYPPVAPKPAAKPVAQKAAAPATESAATTASAPATMTTEATAAPAPKPESPVTPKAQRDAAPKAAPADKPKADAKVTPKSETSAAAKATPKTDAPAAKRQATDGPEAARRSDISRPKARTVAMWGLSTVITLLFR